MNSQVDSGTDVFELHESWAERFQLQLATADAVGISVGDNQPLPERWMWNQGSSGWFTLRLTATFQPPGNQPLK
jgi:hypothetical protein